MLKLLIVAVVVALAAIFLASDADLPLILLPAHPAKSAFQEQVVWIVGASSGIGAALAQDFAKGGAKVVLSSRRVQPMEEVKKKCEALFAASVSASSASVSSPAVTLLPLDVTDYASHQAAYDEVMRTYGKIDVLVLNAGVYQQNTANETDFAITEYVMKLNFLSLVHLTKIVLPNMLERRSGKISVTSSIAGIMGVPVASSYSASKFALHGYFNALRAEVSSYGVQVTLVCPGPVESEISIQSFRNDNHPTAATEGKKMDTARCSHLIAKALYHGFEEVWIADQPYLLSPFVFQYFPWISRQLQKLIFGPARVDALKKGKDLYDAWVSIIGINIPLNSFARLRLLWCRCHSG